MPLAAERAHVLLEQLEPIEAERLLGHTGLLDVRLAPLDRDRLGAVCRELDGVLPLERPEVEHAQLAERAAQHVGRDLEAAAQPVEVGAARARRDTLRQLDVVRGPGPVPLGDLVAARPDGVDVGFILPHDLPA